jgi:microcystin degradation protein MlrC
MAPLRIAVAKFWHESNTFNSVETPLAAFETEGAYSGVKLGAAALPSGDDRNSELSGMLRAFAASSATVEVVPLMSAGTMPSGCWTDDAVLHLEGLLASQLAAAVGGGPLDGVCLALHGAMASRADRDLDGRMLRLVRSAVGDGVPITAALDCHAVVTDEMAEHTLALVSYKTHPHLDLPETGERAATILLGALLGDTAPVQRLERLPMLLADCGTNVGELREIFAEFAAVEATEGVLAASLNMAFPSLDSPEQGWTVVVVTDGDAALADAQLAQLAGRVWTAREALWDELEKGVPMREALAQAAEARAAASGSADRTPVVITDAADNVGGGTPGDTPAVLKELLAHRSLLTAGRDDDDDGLALLHVPDPDAIATLHASGATAGSQITVEVGGKVDPIWGEPVAVTGVLQEWGQGPIENCAPGGAFGGTGPLVETGELALIAVDNVRLVLSELKVQGPHPSIFTAVGLDPFADAAVVLLKSGTGWEVTYQPRGCLMIRADCPGPMSYNCTSFAWEQLSRPIFPLDWDATWAPRPLGAAASVARM